MSSTEEVALPTFRGQARTPPVPLLLVALTLAAISIGVDAVALRLALRVAAIVLALAALLFAILRAVDKTHQADQFRIARHLLMAEPDPGLIVQRDGEILFQNSAFEAAAHAAGRGMISHLAVALRDEFASPEGLIQRLHTRAEAQAQLIEEHAVRGGILRLSVQALSNGLYIWRLLHQGPAESARDDTGPALPMIRVNAEGDILHLSEAAQDLLGDDPATLGAIGLDSVPDPGALVSVEARDGVRPVALYEGAALEGHRDLYVLPIDLPSGDEISGAPAAAWSAVESLPIAMLKIGLQGDILASNQGARLLLRSAIEPGARLGDLLEGLGRPMADWLSEAASGRTNNATEFLRGSGERRDIFVQLALCRPRDGDLSYVIGVLHDVTELKTLEAQFVQSQKMQAIGQLAGGVAHDFNNLLTAIAGHCDLILLRHDPGDIDYSDLIQIHQNANRASALVSQLLAYSRKQDMELVAIDLRSALSELTHLLNRLVGERVQLMLEQKGALPAIRADKQQLEQVVVNLVVNARDAMDNQGVILIRTEAIELTKPLEQDRAHVPPGNYVRISVIDEGKGIEPEMLPHIFEPFYTTKGVGEGTGLGLSTAYGIVKQSGGFIFAQSEVGVGTTFSVYLPAYSDAEALPESAAKLVAQPGAAVAHHGGGTVLLVEDEAPVRAFAARALRLRGYEVLEADSAEAALSLLSDIEVEVDLFVTDVVMPGRDGPSWVLEARKTRPETKVVFMSGYSEEGLREHRSKVPNSVFLPKPFSLNELTEIVAAQLA